MGDPGLQLMHNIINKQPQNSTPFCFQHSFRRYPLGDPGLQLVYDVIGVLTTVHRWAFSTRGWHLRLEAPEQSGESCNELLDTTMP